MIQCMAPHPWVSGMHKLSLVGYSEKKNTTTKKGKKEKMIQSWEGIRVNLGGVRKRIGGEDDQNELYTCMKFSEN